VVTRVWVFEKFDGQLALSKEGSRAGWLNLAGDLAVFTFFRLITMTSGGIDDPVLISVKCRLARLLPVIGI
jgi:hypothetical protein